MPPPESVGTLRSVLGLFNYYRHFVPDFSSTAKPLTSLLQQGVSWRWGVEQQVAFDSLKAALCVEGLALRRPHPDRRFIVHTDWCTLGVGVVLGQLDEEGLEYMVACSSRSLNRHESNYEPWKGELLALVWGVRHFRVYLLGVSFTAVTDHRPLLWLLTQRAPVGQLYRWVLALQEFHFDVLHREGAKHQNADALSRLPLASMLDHTGARLDLDSDPLVAWLPKVTTNLSIPAVELPPESIPSTLEELQEAMRHPWQPPPGLRGTLAAASPQVAQPRLVGQATCSVAAAHQQAPLALVAVMAAAAQIVPVSGALREWIASDHMSELAWVPQEVWGWEPTPDELECTPGRFVSQVLPPHLEASAVLRAACALYVSKALHTGLLTVHAPPALPPVGSSGVDLGLVGPSFFAHLPNGIVLLELFGGLCSGLEAVLRAGWPVAHYLYVDIDPTAQAIARHRTKVLAGRYAHLLPTTALRSAFTTLPDDVNAITSSHLQWLVANRPGQWLVVGGWECQDLSPAGGSKGLRGTRSATFYPLRSILVQLQLLCAQSQLPPPAFLLENTAFQFNWRSQQVAEQDFLAVTQELGEPMVLDAVQFNSYAHRLRNFWSNLILPAEMASMCQVIKRAPNLLAEDVLSPGRVPTEVSRDDAPPFYPANKRGQPRAAFPTIMAYPGTRSTRPGQPGAIKVLATGECTELTAEEREKAMGYEAGTTAAPGVSQQQRCAILGRCIDINTLSHLCALAAAIDKHRVNLHPSCKQPLQAQVAPEAPSADQTEVTPTDVGVAAALSASPVPADGVPTDPPQAEPGERDIWEDSLVLAYLRTGATPSAASSREVSRITSRAARYLWQGDQLYRRWQAGEPKQVPAPDQRLALVREHHEQMGHFGVKRTISLLLHNYWWRGLSSMVKRYVQACVLCGRGNARFTNVSPSLQPLPVAGPGYRWHVDLAGPLPCTERGHAYVLVAVEAFTKWAVLVPIPNKTPESTAFAYLHRVYAHYGGSAELVTDGGGEWAGRFHQQLVKLKVDHRHTSAQHPQANGMAERVVGVLKSGLAKLCVEAAEKLTWDWKVPCVMLGYNCSKQASTRLSPFQLMHGITPMLPSQLRQVYSAPIDPTAEHAADVYWQRAVLLHQLGGAVWQNLLIAQHRDTARYARVRGGSHLPELLQLEPGMLVYLRTPQRTSLNLPAQSTVLQVVQVRPSGVVLLLGADGNICKRRLEQLAPCHLPNVQLTINRQLQYATDDTRCVSCGSADKGEVMLLCDNCGTAQHTFCLDPPLTQVPKGLWLCPTCVAQGHTARRVKEQQREWSRQQAEQRRQERLTPSIEQAAALDGAWLRFQQKGAPGWRGRVNYGQLSFLGVNESGNPRLEVKYQCGQKEELGLRACNTKLRRLLGPGQEPPAASAGMALQQPSPPLGLQGVLQVLHQPPWPVRSRTTRQRLKALLPLVLSERSAHWADFIWLAPALRGWLPQVKNMCWWAAVRVAPEGVPRPPPSSVPLLVTIDTGAAVAEVVEVCQGAMTMTEPSPCRLPGLRRQRQPPKAAYAYTVVTPTPSPTPVSLPPVDDLLGEGGASLVHRLLSQLAERGLLDFPDRDGQLVQLLADRGVPELTVTLGVTHGILWYGDKLDLHRVFNFRSALLECQKRLGFGLQAAHLITQLGEALDTDLELAPTEPVMRVFLAQSTLLVGLEQAYDNIVRLISCGATSSVAVVEGVAAVAASLCSLVGLNLLVEHAALCAEMAHRLAVLSLFSHLTWGEACEAAEGFDAERGDTAKGARSIRLALTAAYPLTSGSSLSTLMEQARVYVAHQTLLPAERSLMEAATEVVTRGCFLSNCTARRVLARAAERVSEIGRSSSAWESWQSDHTHPLLGRGSTAGITQVQALAALVWPMQGELGGSAAAEMAAIATLMLTRAKEPAARLVAEYAALQEVARFMPDGNWSAAAVEAELQRQGREASAGLKRWCGQQGTTEEERLRLLRQVPVLLGQHDEVARCAQAQGRMGAQHVALLAVLHGCQASVVARELVGASSKSSALLKLLLQVAQQQPQVWQHGWSLLVAAVAMRPQQAVVGWPYDRLDTVIMRTCVPRDLEARRLQVQSQWEWLQAEGAVFSTHQQQALTIVRGEASAFPVDPAQLFVTPVTGLELGVPAERQQQLGNGPACLNFAYDPWVPLPLRMGSGLHCEVLPWRGYPARCEGALRCRCEERAHWEGQPLFVAAHRRVWQLEQLVLGDDSDAGASSGVMGAGGHLSSGQPAAANPQHAVWQRVDPAVWPAHVHEAAAAPAGQDGSAAADTEPPELRPLTPEEEQELAEYYEPLVDYEEATPPDILRLMCIRDAWARHLQEQWRRQQGGDAALTQPMEC